MSATTLTRQDALMALALAAVVLVAGSWRMAPGVCGKLHDDAIYVSTAKALASGQGYRQIHLPGAPLQTKYPILYPTVLSAVWRVFPSFPQNLVVMQGFGVVCAAAATALGFLYLVRFGYCSRALAAASSVICSVSPLWLYFAGHTMSEALFAVLLVVALWGVETVLQRAEMTRRGQLMWGAALALPFLCRTIGAAVIVAGLFVLWRQRRPAGWYSCGAVVTALPWVVWSLQGWGGFQENAIDGYYTDYLGSWTSTGPSLMWPVVRTNTLLVAYGSGLLSLEGLAEPLHDWLGPGGAYLVLILAGLAPWAVMLRDLRTKRALPWMLVTYLAVMLVWPWPPLRFLAPIFPFLMIYLCLGWATGAKPLKHVWGCRAAGVGSLAAIVLANVVLLAGHAEQVRQTGFPMPQPGERAIAWSSYERLFSWLRENSREQDVIAASLDSMIGLYADRQAFRPFAYDPGYLYYGRPASDQCSEDLADVLRRYRAAYLVLSPTPDLSDEVVVAEKVNELRASYPGWLEVAYRDADPRFVVFQLHPEHEPTGGRSAMLGGP